MPKTPSPAVHKVIVSNRARLTEKYGDAFTGKVEPALSALVAADAQRGLNSIVIYLDDRAAMRSVRGSPVSSPGDERTNKSAVDAVFNFYNPDYLVLLGASDVIPHQTLGNPAFDPGSQNGDPDRVVPSDLPYACPGPYDSAQDIKAFLNPTRVVGRLPDITNGKDAGILAAALSAAANFKPKSAADYEEYLGVSAAVWKKSTQLSLASAFGNNGALQVVPPRTYRWTSKQLAALSHFFNCHGATTDPHYYGQPADGAETYPVAYDAAYLQGKIKPGTIGAAECCYGAELYDPALANGQPGIANVYMAAGAAGFFGSTTIAYGPGDSNDYADLLCQNFFAKLLAGSSTGRAVLEARQKYIGAKAQLSPVDLKTIAQFYLLGDPCIQPVGDAAPKPKVLAMSKGLRMAVASEELAGAGERAERRAALIQRGLSVGRSVALPGQKVATAAGIKAHLFAMVRDLGVKNDNMMFLSCNMNAPLQARVLGGMMKGLAAPRVAKAIHTAIGRLPTPDNIKTPRLAGVEIVEFDGTFIERQFHSR